MPTRLERHRGAGSSHAVVGLNLFASGVRETPLHGREMVVALRDGVIAAVVKITLPQFVSETASIEQNKDNPGRGERTNHNV